MAIKRNGEIDFLRFLFAMIIVFYHFNASFQLGFFVNGYIGVEFFFIVSGFLMAKHVERNGPGRKDLAFIADETWRYIIKKVGTFYCYYLSVIFLQVIVRFILIRHDGITTIFNRFLGSIPTFSLTFAGLNMDSAALSVGNTWYLSAMLIAIFILFPFLLRHYHFSVKILFPLIALFVTGYLYGTNHSISNWIGWSGLVYFGVLRATAEMALGGSLFCLSSYLTEKNSWVVDTDKWTPKLLLTFVKLFCYAVVVLYAYGSILGIKVNKTFDLHALLFCALGILLSFSNVGFCIPDSKVTRYLSKISLPIFIFHGFIRWSCWDYIGHTDISKKLFAALIVMSLFASVGLMYLTDGVTMCLQRIRKKDKEKV